MRERSLKVAAAAFADAMGSVNVMDPLIKAVYPGARLAGPAFTVKAYPGSIITVHHALIEASPGDVIVVDDEEDRGGAMFGELMARDARARKLGGLVVDGPVRDVNGIKELDFPVFARYRTPRVATNRRLGQLQVPVTCGGVVVRPGDYIVGDDDGVVVIPKERLEEIVAAGEAIEVKEDGIARRIDAGEYVCDIIGLRAAIESQLQK